MSYGPGTPNTISECAARWLDVHPYFNPDQVKTEQRGHIKMLSSSITYPPNDVHHFFEVTDPDGLYMIRFLHGPLHVYSYKPLSGEKEIVKFSTTTLGLKNNKVNIQMADVNGGIRYGGWHSFDGIEPRMVLDISTEGSEIDNGLIGYWSFDEANGQYAFDASGNGNYAKLGSGAALEFNGGKIGGALRLDYSKGVYVSNGGEFINGLNALTLSLWVKSDKVNTDKGFIFYRNPNGDDKIFSMRYDAKGSGKEGGTNVIKAGITTTEGVQIYESANDVQTTEWQHLTLTWQSGKKLTLYINGVLDQPTLNSKATQGEVTGVSQLLIGRGSKDRRGSWDGLIDDVRLYNRVLNEREIMDLALVGKAVPLHGVALTGVCNLTPEAINAHADFECILTVTNTGNTDDTIKLVTSGNAAATLDETSLLLIPGASSKVTLTVPRAVFTNAGDYIAKVTATSAGDSTKTAQITTATTIPPIHGVALAGIGNLTNETIDANTGVEYTLEVTNTGNTDDTIRLATSGDATATLSQTSVLLAPGASEKVTLKVAADTPTTVTDSLVKVTGTSENDSAKTTQITTLTTFYPSAIVHEDLQDSLIGHWTFDEENGKNAADVSGHDNNAILNITGEPWRPNDGKIGGALQFNGSDGATVVNGADLLNELESFTLVFWVKSDKVNIDRGFISPKTPNGKDHIFSMRYDEKGAEGGGTNVIKAGITTSEGHLTYESASDVQTTEWQHLALTWRSGRELTLYINGVLDQPTFNSAATQGKMTGAKELLIGKGSQDKNRSWEGLIDDVRLYNRVLSGREIADLPLVTTTTIKP